MTSEFLHHLRDTIILLGGGTKIANMVEHAETASAADVDELRRLNLRLIDATKERLASINRLTIVADDNHRDS
jgi:hypothetical protein